MGNYVSFGCTNCGSVFLDKIEDGKKLRCKHCKREYLSDFETDEQRDARVLYLERLDAAEKCLRLSPPKFDEAEYMFRDFINEYSNRYEGYWGLVRARYGIKLEKDINGKEVPSCYISAYEDFREDSDFKKALKLATHTIIYKDLKEKAELIADVCNEWREEARKYSYDIFISFKDENDELSISDEDRKEMNNLYEYLVDEGYNVFFSPRTLRKITGKHYDPYIFNALQTAKAMIVYGSKPEYFSMTWVQNEWTRFLRMQAKGDKKKGSCIVAYNGFKPRELPFELRGIQAIDASKNNRFFYHDILKAIKEVFKEEKKVDSNEELMRKIAELERKQAEEKKEEQRRQEELQKKLEESKKQQEALEKSLEEEKKKNSNKPNTISEEARTPETAATIKVNQATKKAEVFDPDFEIVDGCLKKYNGKKAEVVIPDGVTSIGEEAFYNCSSLVSVVIPDSVTSVGYYVFPNCSSLTSITVDENNLYYKSIDGNLYAKDGTTLISYAIGKKDTSFEIPSSVTSIGYYAFRNCHKLTNITIPNSVTSIGSSAFYGCESLTSVDIGNGVTSIGLGVFSHCSSLTSITIPDSVTSIGNYAFYNCSSLTSVVIGDSVASIGCRAFQGCSSLTIFVNDLEQTKKWDPYWNPDNRPVKVIEKAANVGAGKTSSSKTNVTPTAAVAKREVSKPDPDFEIKDGCLVKYKGNKAEVVIPDGVTSIGESAFWHCTDIKSITIPDSVTTIGYCAFERCSSLTSITIPSVTSIGNSAFSNCSRLANITIPNSVTTIGDNTFIYCKSLTSITIPDNVTTIGKDAFAFCDSLASITIPNSVTSIGYRAFYGCSSLTSITIPDSVTSIGSYVFENCSSLTSITIPNSVTEIGGGAFRGCASIASITVDVNNQYYKSIDGNLYTKDGTTLIQYAIGKRAATFEIPSSVTEIGGVTFRGCSSLTSITIPGNVTSIHKRAFDGCMSLASAIFEDSKGWVATNKMPVPLLFLNNAKTAAKYLTSTFVESDWTKK